MHEYYHSTGHNVYGFTTSSSNIKTYLGRPSHKTHSVSGPSSSSAIMSSLYKQDRQTCETYHTCYPSRLPYQTALLLIRSILSINQPKQSTLIFPCWSECPDSYNTQSRIKATIPTTLTRKKPFDQTRRQLFTAAMTASLCLHSRVFKCPVSYADTQLTWSHRREGDW